MATENRCDSRSIKRQMAVLDEISCGAKPLSNEV